MSTLTVSPGFSTIEEEFEASLRKCFVDRGWSSIRVDDRRCRFQLEAMGHGEEKGWLQVDLVEVEEQYSYYKGSLTEAGKEHFGLVKGRKG